MEITLSDVKQAFRDLIEGRITREEANAWAHEYVQAADNRELNYSPRSTQDVIWNGIIYLYGVDLANSPTSGDYLLDLEDIRQRFSELFGELPT